MQLGEKKMQPLGARIHRVPGQRRKLSRLVREAKAGCGNNQQIVRKTPWENTSWRYELAPRKAEGTSLST